MGASARSGELVSSTGIWCPQLSCLYEISPQKLIIVKCAAMPRLVPLIKIAQLASLLSFADKRDLLARLLYLHTIEKILGSEVI